MIKPGIRRKISLYILLISLCISIPCIVGCDNSDDNDSGDAWEIIFTTPGGDDAVLERAIEMIEAAENSIYVVTFLFELDDVADALIAAHDRGVEVVVIGESDNDDYDSDYGTLTSHGVEVRYDNSSEALHNKLMVIDSSIVWTGCTNFTYNGYFSNNNSVVVLYSNCMADAYLAEIAQFMNGDFQDDKVSDGIESCNIGNGMVEVYFGPQDDPEELLIDAVNSAQSSIDIGIYAFTLDDLADALIDAHNRGVTVRGIFDESQAYESWSQFEDIRDAGLDVWTDPAPYAFHHKFMIIDPSSDNPSAIVSSGNYSINGTDNNDENFLVIHSTDIIAQYRQEFNRWWREIDGKK